MMMATKLSVSILSLALASVSFAMPVPGPVSDGPEEKARRTSRNSALSHCTTRGKVKTCTLNKLGGIVVGVILGKFLFTTASELN